MVRQTKNSWLREPDTGEDGQFPTQGNLARLPEHLTREVDDCCLDRPAVECRAPSALIHRKRIAGDPHLDSTVPVLLDPSPLVGTIAVDSQIPFEVRPVLDPLIGQ